MRLSENACEKTINIVGAAKLRAPPYLGQMIASVVVLFVLHGVTPWSLDGVLENTQFTLPAERPRFPRRMSRYKYSTARERVQFNVCSEICGWAL